MIKSRGEKKKKKKPDDKSGSDNEGGKVSTLHWSSIAAGDKFFFFSLADVTLALIAPPHPA